MGPASGRTTLGTACIRTFPVTAWLIALMVTDSGARAGFRALSIRLRSRSPLVVAPASTLVRSVLLGISRWRWQSMDPARLVPREQGLPRMVQRRRDTAVLRAAEPADMPRVGPRPAAAVGLADRPRARPQPAAAVGLADLRATAAAAEWPVAEQPAVALEATADKQAAPWWIEKGPDGSLAIRPFFIWLTDLSERCSSGTPGAKQLAAGHGGGGWHGRRSTRPHRPAAPAGSRCK